MFRKFKSFRTYLHHRSINQCHIVHVGCVAVGENRMMEFLDRRPPRRHRPTQRSADVVQYRVR